MHKQNATAWALLIALAGLTGCIGGETSDEPSTGSPNRQAALDSTGAEVALNNSTANVSTALPPGFTQTGCTLHVGLIPLPADMVASEVPEGWATVPFQDVPGMVEGFVSSITCGDTQGDNLTDGEADAMGMGLIVGVPGALAGPDANAILLEFVSDRDDMVARLHAWGMHGSEVAEVQVNDVLSPAAAVTMGQAHYDWGSVYLTMQVPGTPFDLGATQIRLFALEDLVPVGAFDLSWGDAAGIGPGTVELVIVGSPPVPDGPPLGGLSTVIGPDLTLTSEPFDVRPYVETDATRSANATLDWRALL